MARDPASLGVNLASRVAAILTRTRVDSTAALMPHVTTAVADTIRVAAAGFRGGDITTVKQVLEDNFGSSPLDDKTVSIVDSLYKVHPILATPLIAVALTLSVLRLLGAAAQPFVDRVQQSAYRANQVRTLDPGTAADAYARTILNFDEAFEEVQTHGFSEDRWHVLRRLAEQVPAVEVAFAMRNRKIIDDEGLRQILERQGFTDNDIFGLLELRHVLPGAQDVVRFAVRDVYRPEAVSRGGLLEDLPAAGVRDAERIGLSEEEFKKYWASHWVLPSVTNAFEMFHRGVITENELRGLLRTQDIAPGWRDELVEIAFNVISRVDIRRMYREGIADRAKVYSTYLDQGYKPADAEALTEFAIADATVDTRDLTKSEVIGLYQDGAVTRAEGAAMLGDLGYPDEEVGWLLTLAEFRRFRRFRDLAISRVRSRYVGRRISESEASAALDRLGVPTAERDGLVDLWESERDVERPALTGAFVGGLYRESIITEEEARVRWGQQGYRSDDIDLLVLNYSGGDPDGKKSGGPNRQLTKADIGRALREGTLSTDEAVREWVAMGYSEPEALILAANYLPEGET